MEVGLLNKQMNKQKNRRRGRGNHLRRSQLRKSRILTNSEFKTDTKSEKISLWSINLENLLNQLKPTVIINNHLISLKKALFHSHTKVVQVAIKQFIRLGSEKSLVGQLSKDMEVVLGMIENLAHKEQKVARDCVKVLLLLSSTNKSLMHLLCPDVTNVLKTIMTYVAVRLLVYEFVLQLSLNSSSGLEKSHSCGILEDIINDLKKKESYLTEVHYWQLCELAATSHGYNYLVKYSAVDTVSKLCPVIPNEKSTTHLITVIPEVHMDKLGDESAEEKN